MSVSKHFERLLQLYFFSYFHYFEIQIQWLILDKTFLYFATSLLWVSFFVLPNRPWQYDSVFVKDTEGSVYFPFEVYLVEVSDMMCVFLMFSCKLHINNLSKTYQVLFYFLR